MFSVGRRKSPYLVEIGEDDDFLDVPARFVSTEHYVASTGHKVNHKKESNGRFEECLHPRFGWIHCFISNRVKMMLLASAAGPLSFHNYFRLLAPVKSSSASTTSLSIVTA